MSPLDEMNNQPAETDKGKTKKDTKRPIKVAKNKKYIIPRQRPGNGSASLTSSI